ncbi:hypothetical protein [Nocardia sp. CNY236]|uniref:hypothetical protein n=1 Tax=Nocardia sp. CNY236 TaxID=1169152 RepID=UPI00042067E4|nr:hypothetical protein [Nocardia sp. CNY236]
MIITLCTVVVYLVLLQAVVYLGASVIGRALAAWCARRFGIDLDEDPGTELLDDPDAEWDRARDRDLDYQAGVA